MTNELYRLRTAVPGFQGRNERIPAGYNPIFMPSLMSWAMQYPALVSITYLAGFPDVKFFSEKGSVL